MDGRTDSVSTDCRVDSKASSSLSTAAVVPAGSGPNGHRVRKRKLSPSANVDEPPPKKAKTGSSTAGCVERESAQFLRRHRSERRVIERAFDGDRFDDDESDEDLEDNPERKLKVTVLTPPPGLAPGSPAAAIWVKLEDILRSGFKYDSTTKPTVKETQCQFIEDVELYLKRNGIAAPLDAFIAKMGSTVLVSEKGHCLLMLMMRDFDRNSVAVDHWIAFRFYCLVAVRWKKCTLSLSAAL